MTNNDPWEIETTPAPPVGGTPVAAPKAAAPAVQGPNEGTTVTLKGGKGYDAAWIVLHAADPAAALAQLKSAELRELIELTGKVGAYFAGTGAQTPAPGPSGPAPSAPTGSAKPAYQQGPGGPKYCDHGEKVFKSGVSQRTQKPWKAYDCPNGVCDREFVR